MNTLADTPRQCDGTLDLNGIACGLVSEVLNAMMDEQADAFCKENDVSRNGYRERGLTTGFGELRLRIPKLRMGTYFPEDIVERWSRTDTALVSTICEMWAGGVSTRKIDDVARKMGVEKMSRSRVSRMCRCLDEEVDALRHRRLDDRTWPYLWLDATYFCCREDGAALSKAMITAIAADDGGRRQVVGMECIDAESYPDWRDFLLGLRGRGLEGVRLVVSDDHAGLVRAIREVLVGASWQRCIVHLERNVAQRARKRKTGDAAVAALKAAFSQKTPALVRAGYDAAIEVYGRYDEAGADLLESAREDALAYLAFPQEHHRWIRTNNVSERFNREIKRRIDVVQVFPSFRSAERLIGALCCNQNDEWCCERRFIDRESMGDPGPVEVDWSVESWEISAVLRQIDEAFQKKNRAA